MQKAFLVVRNGSDRVVGGAAETVRCAPEPGNFAACFGAFALMQSCVICAWGLCLQRIVAQMHEILQSKNAKIEKLEVVINELQDACTGVLEEELEALHQHRKRLQVMCATGLR